MSWLQHLKAYPRQFPGTNIILQRPQRQFRYRYFLHHRHPGQPPLKLPSLTSQPGTRRHGDWNFGDGNTSILENPTNTYAVNGTYTVSLTEVNSINSNETTMTGYIVVGATTPVAAFSASPLSGIAPLTVQFIDQSTGSPTQWEWSFGDGIQDQLRARHMSIRTRGHIRLPLYL